MKFGAVISSHGDGEILSNIISSYGLQTIRGSSRHKSFSAMSGMIRSVRDGRSLALTPDGPIGPRFKINGNICEFTNKFSLPIVPICYSATNAKVLNTWDRFLIPIPLLSVIYIEIGKPILCNSGKAPIENKALEEIMLKQMKFLDKRAGLKIDY
jgi:lysophospholipid acyltransferase (LPLAT)-like uncharacterized protein